ncbi:hypothetical protein IE53DRAFT_390225 [Violaceomyces palustris]|uniref:Uncharacterized protein n=1 Tax=Violaceomyces palustris TaxID=1673888 RepID=A0ACD0NPB7_9BASI|nr:hypothetical protein IE53DRAFT_390225 [Violaceomyces palustris]
MGGASMTHSKRNLTAQSPTRMKIINEHRRQRANPSSLYQTRQGPRTAASDPRQTDKQTDRQDEREKRGREREREIEREMDRKRVDDTVRRLAEPTDIQSQIALGEHTWLIPTRSPKVLEPSSKFHFENLPRLCPFASPHSAPRRPARRRDAGRQRLDKGGPFPMTV